MNFLVGASGSLRKAIYEFLKDQKTKGENYEDKIKWLKTKYPGIDSVYFDSMANIQDMTSTNMHEKDGSWEPWKRADLSFFIEVVKAVLDEIYVKPDERKKTLDMITKLKSKTTIQKKITNEKKS